MDLPLHPLGLISNATALASGAVIGIGFGICLARAGMGQALHLVGQFYLRDFRVLKVMFTAIVTATTGLALLDRLGAVDLSEVYVPPTVAWAQAIGGGILGIGFLVGGYCPGTALIGVTHRRWDAVACVGGLVAGLLAVGWLWPQGAAYATHGPATTMPLATGLSLPLCAVLLNIGAAGVFLAVHRVECRLGLVAGPLQSPLMICALLTGTALVATMLPEPVRQRTVFGIDTMTALAQQSPARISPVALAERILAGEPTLLVDLRTAGVPVPARSHLRIERSPADGPAAIILADDETRAVQAWMALTAQGSAAVIVDGHAAAWRDQIVAPLLLRDSPVGQDRIQKIGARAAAFGGAPRWIEPGANPTPSAERPLEPSQALPPQPPQPRIRGGCP